MEDNFFWKRSPPVPRSPHSPSSWWHWEESSQDETKRSQWWPHGCSIDNTCTKYSQLHQANDAFDRVEKRQWSQRSQRLLYDKIFTYVFYMTNMYFFEWFMYYRKYIKKILFMVLNIGYLDRIGWVLFISVRGYQTIYRGNELIWDFYIKHIIYTLNM